MNCVKEIHFQLWVIWKKINIIHQHCKQMKMNETSWLSESLVFCVAFGIASLTPASCIIAAECLFVNWFNGEGASS